MVQYRIDDVGLLGGRDSEVMILFRWTPGLAIGNGYSFGYIGLHGGMFGIWKLNGNSLVGIPPALGMEPLTGIWRIEAKGEDLQFFLNDELQFRVEDETFSKGKVSIRCAFSSITPV